MTRRPKNVVAKGMLLAGTGRGKPHTSTKNTRRSRAKAERELAADVSAATSPGDKDPRS